MTEQEKAYRREYYKKNRYKCDGYSYKYISKNRDKWNAYVLELYHKKRGKPLMPDRCFKDSGECYHDCPECNSYRPETDCPECGNETPRSEIDRYDGMCRACRLKEEFDNRELLDEFFKDNPEIKQSYLDYLDDGWNK